MVHGGESGPIGGLAQGGVGVKIQHIGWILTPHLQVFPCSRLLGLALLLLAPLVLGYASASSSPMLDMRQASQLVCTPRG